MNKAMIRRVAKYHSTNPGCAPFNPAKFTPQTWRGHFESDAAELQAAVRWRKPLDDEAARIEVFLVATNG